jgi:hypothetical protein
MRQKIFKMKSKLLMLCTLVLFGMFALGINARADNALALANQIRGFTGGGIATDWDATASGDEVTVTGTLTGVTAALTLNIDAGVKVIWDATMTVNHAGWGGKTHLIDLGGAQSVASANPVSSPGEFIMRGGYLESRGSAIYGGMKVTIEGGVIYADVDNTHAAIRGGDAGCALTVLGGKIEAYNTAAANAGSAIGGFTGAGTTVTISGGKIIGTAFGTNPSTNYAVITAGGPAPVLVIDGEAVVFGYGNDIIGQANIIHNFKGVPTYFAAGDIQNDAVVIAWDKVLGYTTYSLLSQDELSFSPPETAGTIVFWSIQGTESGIYYKNGANEGFIPVPGVTVSCQLLNDINAYCLGGLVAELNATNDTIFVTGECMNATSTLLLDIPATLTVVWNAKIQGNVGENIFLQFYKKLCVTNINEPHLEWNLNRYKDN